MSQNIPGGPGRFPPSLLRWATSRNERILSFALVLLVTVGSIALMFKYSQDSFNGVVATNALSTTQAQTDTAQATLAAPTETASAATAKAASVFVTHITATAIAATNATAQAEAQASPIPYPPQGRAMVLQESLSSERQDIVWGEDNDSFGSCSFTNGAYQVVSSYHNSFEYCLAKPTNYTNFIYQMQMTISDGDSGGLVFRVDHAGRKFYRFLIKQDGSYSFSAFDLNQSVKGIALTSGFNPAINIGLNTPNVIAVVVHKDIFELYVNQVKIAVVGDKKYANGSIGVFAQYEQSPTTVIFQNAQVWI